MLLHKSIQSFYKKRNQQKQTTTKKQQQPQSANDIDFVDLLYMENLQPHTLLTQTDSCLLYTSPSPRDCIVSRMPSSA